MSGTHAALRAACDAIGLSIQQLWVDYVTLGGNLPAPAIRALIHDGHDIGDHDFDLVVQALNERLMERPDYQPLPYSDELPSPGPAADVLPYLDR